MKTNFSNFTKQLSQKDLIKLTQAAKKDLIKLTQKAPKEIEQFAKNLKTAPALSSDQFTKKIANTLKK